MEKDPDVVVFVVPEGFIPLGLHSPRASSPLGSLRSALVRGVNQTKISNSVKYSYSSGHDQLHPPPLARAPNF